MKKFSIVLVLASLFAAQAFAYTFDSNVPADLQAQMTADLNFMGTLQGTAGSPLHVQIFGATISGASYKPWFETRIAKIGLNSCGNPNAVACVIPLFGSDKMFITQNYIRFSHPAIARSMVVYHEARHSETNHGNWSHATCPRPFLDANGQDMKSIWTGASLAGEPACDITPLGSYGSSTILLKNISKNCTNCTAKVKQDAGIYADDQFKRITDAGARTQMMNDIFRSGPARR